MRYFTSTVNIGRFCRTTLLLIVHVSVALCTGEYMFLLTLFALIEIVQTLTEIR